MMVPVLIKVVDNLGAPIGGATYFVVKNGSPPNLAVFGEVADPDTGIVGLALDDAVAHFLMAEKPGYISDCVRFTPEEGALYEVLLTPEAASLPKRSGCCRIVGRVVYADGSPFNGTVWIGVPDGVAVDGRGDIMIGDAAVQCEEGVLDIELDRGRSYIISGVWNEATEVYVPDTPTARASDVLVPYAIRVYEPGTDTLGDKALVQGTSLSLTLHLDLSDRRSGAADLREFIEVSSSDTSVAAVVRSADGISIYAGVPGEAEISVHTISQSRSLPIRLPRVLLASFTVGVSQ